MFWAMAKTGSWSGRDRRGELRQVIPDDDVVLTGAVNNPGDGECAEVSLDVDLSAASRLQIAPHGEAGEIPCHLDLTVLGYLERAANGKGAQVSANGDGPPCSVDPPGSREWLPVLELAPPPLTVRLPRLPATAIPPPWEAAMLPPTVRQLAFPPTARVPSSNVKFPVMAMPLPRLKALVVLAAAELVVLEAVGLVVLSAEMPRFRVTSIFPPSSIVTLPPIETGPSRSRPISIWPPSRVTSFVAVREPVKSLDTLI
jgi:hypothetical protein